MDAPARTFGDFPAAVLVFPFLAIGLVALAAPCQGQTGPADPPADLRCEYRVNPLGIDVVVPRLSWQLRDGRRGAVQSACQVVVSTDESFANAEAVVWDSGKVVSDQSVHVAYAGEPLASGTRYYWKVRAWDAEGRPTEYSQPAWFEMGLLSPADWKARWITVPPPDSKPAADLAGAKWIWNAQAEGDQKEAWFRRTFTIPAGRQIERGHIRVTADNEFILYLNGREIGKNDNYTTPEDYEVGEKLHPGKNLLALKCRNSDGPAGLVLSMLVVLQGGGSIDVKTDESWKTRSAQAPDWTQIDLDETGWDQPKVLGNYGDKPWGQLHRKTGPRRSACMRQKFGCKGKPVRARMYATGLGLYKLYLNGRPVGEDILSPGWTDYRYRVQYQTYDVTDLLQAGPNAIGAILGNGWWSGGMAGFGTEGYSGGDLRLLAQLVIDHADGGRDIIITDQDWKTHPSPITRDTLYHGETYDARLEMPGWSSAGFDDGGWRQVSLVPDGQQKALLVADKCAPIRVTQELPAAWVSEPEKGVYIFDFGQNASGVARLKVQGAKGTTIRLRFGEELDPSGRLYRDNYRSAEATDYYICKGSGEEVWEPLFTYRGFRYCEVTGYPGRPANDAVTFRVFHNDLPAAGVFECSNPLLTRLFTSIAWGQRSNLHSVPTDCPQRDERLGWTGDANVFGPTSCWNMDMAGFYHKWMRDVMDSQSPEGWVTDVAPGWLSGGPAAPGWGDACVTTPYTVWRFYGDRRIIEETFDAMVKWVEYMHAQRDAKSGLYERKGYGDWVAPVDSPKDTIGGAYYYYSTKLLAEMAQAIGRSAEAEKYRQRAEEIAALFNKAWFDAETNQYPGETQTANLLPLHFGITPPERRAAVMANIVENIKTRDYHLSTGFLGTAYLMTTLADYGRQHTAWKLASQTTCPSWLYMLLNGATTIWERWDTDKWGPSMNSRNHYAFGAVGQWMIEDLAGIHPATPGFKRIIIRPRPAGDLRWAGATYASMYGDIKSKWRRTAGGLRLDVTVPPNTTARVCVPTLGKSSPTVREGGTLVHGPGSQPVAGVKPAGSQGGFVRFDVAAGVYRFVVGGE